MDIENLPKGCVPDPIDERDYKIESLGATPQVDWSREFRLPDPGNEDQGTSDSCVAQAWSYYHTQLHPKNYSRRDLFCRIALDYGAYIRDGGWQVVNNGQATRDEVFDPTTQTPQNMRDKTGTKQEYRDDDKELNYFVLPGDIDTVASAVKTYKGVVFGVTGSNPGWQDLANPRPPFPGEAQWGHALYAYGYHVHDGWKCIIAKSSWCNTGITEHHIKENYFNSGMTFNPWTLIPKEQIMFKVKKIKINGAYGVLIDTPNGAQIIKATNEAQYRSFSKPDSYQAHTVNADGSTDFTVDLEINFQ
jgi:hypothetical protein